MSPVARDVFSNGSIAHDSLKGQVQADRFSAGTLCRVITPVGRLHLEHGSPNTDRQILFGHPVCQLEAEQGLSRDETSGYVGYISPMSLGSWNAPTHRVKARATLLFASPDIKSPAPITLSLGSLLAIAGTEGGFARTLDGNYAIMDHLEPMENLTRDLASTAEQLLGTPYLWGGNSSFGIDCSGLIQLCAQRAGLPCPGDSDQQQALGEEATTPYQRNDLLFWKGHVALVSDAETLIHANAHSMMVNYEPIAEAISRIANKGDGPVTAHRRLRPFSG